MSHPEISGPERVAQALGHMADAVIPAQEIDEQLLREIIEPHKLIMTSMGNRRKALITPFFPSINFVHNIEERLFWAKTYQRPLLEAVVGYSERRTTASVTLRNTLGEDIKSVLETVWQYPLKPDEEHQTTWDVVDTVQEQAGNGLAVPARSGVINLSEERLKAGNWAISHPLEPDVAARLLAIAIENAPFELN